jgi:hypothetical protein
LKRQSRMESSVPFIENPTLRLGHVSLLTDIVSSNSIWNAKFIYISYVDTSVHSFIENDN